jgi:hypothetical protein
MELALKPDFDRAVERLEAWWHCEVLDRACVQLTVRRPGGGKPIPQKGHSTLRELWMDAQYQVERAAAALTHSMSLGEAFPAYMPNLGPDLCATLFGAELEFAPGTSWAVPVVADWETADLAPNFDNPYWQTVREMTALSLEVGRGQFITAITDLHTNGDILSAIRGREALCLDLADRPELVVEALRRVSRLYPAMYDDLYGPIRARGLGSTTWMSIYHQGRCYGTNMDFAGLISPTMFQKHFLPVIEEETKFLDRSCFHLDGPTALPHLDALLELPTLHGVQWVYGAGNGPSTRWMDVYRRIQNAGKCAQVLVEHVREIEAILDELPPDGLLFTGGGWGLSPDEAQSALRMAERKSAQHAHRRLRRP